MPSSLVSVPAAARSDSSAGSVARTTSRARWKALALNPLSWARSRQCTTRSRAASGVIATEGRRRALQRHRVASSEARQAGATDPLVERAEHQRVDEDADDEDDDHHGDQARRVVEVAGLLQQEADGRPEDDDQLAGHQAAPGERPALLEAADERRQRRRQHDVAELVPPPRPHHVTGPQEHRRHVVDAGDQPVGDRRRRAEHDDEQDGALGQLEQQDGQREPGDRRHRLQAGDHRADGRADDPRRRHDGADQHADERAPARSRRRPAPSSCRGPGTRCRRRSSRRAAGTRRAVPGRAYSGRQPDHTTHCHRNRASATAASLGHVAAHPRRARSALPCWARSTSATVALSSRSTSALAAGPGGRPGTLVSGSTTSMGERLLTELVGHGGGERADLGRVDAAGPLDGDVEAGRDPARPRRHDDDAVAQAGRLAHVVGDEHDGQARGRARACRARRGARRGSSRRGRRTARPSAGCRRPGRTPGPARRAGACRPTAGAGASWRSPRGARPSAAARPAPGARPWARRPGASAARRWRPRSATGTAPTPGTSARRGPRTSTVPALGVSSPATRLRIVDLPQPEAPMRQTNSPCVHLEVDVVERGDALAPDPNVLSTPAEPDRTARSRARSTSSSPRSARTSLSSVRS